jgi:UrcA family protein
MNTAHLHLRPSGRAGLRVAALAAGIVAASVAGVSAAATSATDAPSVIVHYADLDLATPQGAQTLYRRIAAAARKVCPNTDQRDLAAVAQNRNCREQAIAGAVRDVDRPLLASVYAEHLKRS